MPQANITYDAPYNRGMVKFIEELDRKHWEKAYPAYHPNPMGFRLGSFHGEPVSQVKVGGGSSPLKYNPAGNSPAYPPMNMNAGMAVSSGGARYSGVDGAVGGKKLNLFDVGYDLGHDVIGPALLGKGTSGGRTYAQRLARRTRNDLKKVGKVLAPAVPFLKDEVLPIVKKVGLKLLEKKLNQAAEGAGSKRKVGGKKFNFLGAIKDVGHEVGEIYPDPVSIALMGLGKGKPKAASKGRNVRAEIVKKVMKERGVKMIEASKIVKAEGLY